MDDKSRKIEELQRKMAEMQRDLDNLRGDATTAEHTTDFEEVIRDAQDAYAEDIKDEGKPKSAEERPSWMVDLDEYEKKKKEESAPIKVKVTHFNSGFTIRSIGAILLFFVMTVIIAVVLMILFMLINSAIGAALGVGLSRWLLIIIAVGAASVITRRIFKAFL